MRPIKNPIIKTVGHSNHPIERFVDLLRTGGVQVLVDVRSTPWSRRFPQFGKDRLAKSLTEAGIAYAHEGAALGGKPDGGGSYEDLAARPAFREALDRLTARAAGSTPPPNPRPPPPVHLGGRSLPAPRRSRSRCGEGARCSGRRGVSVAHRRRGRASCAS